MRKSELTPELAERLADAREVSGSIQKAIDATIDEHLGQPIELDDTWRASEHTRLVYDNIKADLLERTNEGRNAMRAAALQIDRALIDEKAITEDAWHDLRRELEMLVEQSGNDCWKLDGPHLDGRFPRKPPTEAAPETEEASEKKKKNEIAAAR